MSEVDVQGLGSVVSLTFDSQLSYSLMSEVKIEVTEAQAGLYKYRLLFNKFQITLLSESMMSGLQLMLLRIDNSTILRMINRKWKSSRTGVQDFQKSQILELKVLSCHKSFKSTVSVRFYAIGFSAVSFPQNVYLRATVLACPNTVQNCARQDCTAVTLTSPTRRRRRDVSEKVWLKMHDKDRSN